MWNLRDESQKRLDKRETYVTNDLKDWTNGKLTLQRSRKIGQTGNLRDERQEGLDKRETYPKRKNRSSWDGTS